MGVEDPSHYLTDVLGWRWLAAGLAALLVAFVPLVPRQPYWTVRTPAPAFFASGGQVGRVPEGSVALVAPVANFGDADAMLWQATSGMRFRMPEAYAILPASNGGVLFAPPPTPTTQALMDAGQGATPGIGSDAARRSIRADLAALGVQTVIVGPMANEDRAVALLTWAIGRPPERVEGVFVWWNVQGGT